MIQQTYPASWLYAYRTSPPAMFRGEPIYRVGVSYYTRDAGGFWLGRQHPTLAAAKSYVARMVRS